MESSSYHRSWSSEQGPACPPPLFVLRAGAGMSSTAIGPQSRDQHVLHRCWSSKQGPACPPPLLVLSRDRHVLHRCWSSEQGPACPPPLLVFKAGTGMSSTAVGPQSRDRHVLHRCWSSKQGPACPPPLLVLKAVTGLSSTAVGPQSRDCPVLQVQHLQLIFQGSNIAVYLLALDRRDDWYVISGQLCTLLTLTCFTVS